jgi:hypothetical protein
MSFDICNVIVILLQTNFINVYLYKKEHKTFDRRKKSKREEF